MDDSQEFYHLIIHSKEHLEKWLTWVNSVESIEDTDESLKLRIERLVENKGYPMWFAIIYKGNLAGAIGFNDMDEDNNVGEMGYFLGEPFQQKGVMSRAYKAVIDYGFETLGLNRIEAYIADGNERSKALPRRFGFTEEGKIRQAEWLYDHYEDEIIYGLLAEEWN